MTRVNPSFDNSYARLPEAFHSRQAPTPVARPELFALNRDLAAVLGLDPDWLAGEEGLAMLSGNRLPPGAQPIAMAYAGHQFGHWVPRLGDGRSRKRTAVQRSAPKTLKPSVFSMLVFMLGSGCDRI